MREHSRTIVGGRSSGSAERKDFPRGIEILLKKASVDPGFRELLLRDPVGAADSIELALKESERRVLASTSQSVLSAMIRNTFVPRHHVRSFLTQKAPALLMLLLASTVGYEAAASAGIESRSVASPRIKADSAEKLAVVQRALEQYRKEYGGYPSTNAWLGVTNPLAGYVEVSYLFDPWGRKLHYEGVTDASGEVSNYRLESLGWYSHDPSDNIPCPIDPEIHSFQ